MMSCLWILVFGSLIAMQGADGETLPEAGSEDGGTAPEIPSKDENPDPDTAPSENGDAETETVPVAEEPETSPSEEAGASDPEEGTEGAAATDTDPEETEEVQEEPTEVPADDSADAETEPTAVPDDDSADAETEPPAVPADDSADSETEPTAVPEDDSADAETEPPVIPADNSKDDETEPTAVPEDDSADAETEPPAVPADDSSDSETEAPVTPADDSADSETVIAENGAPRIYAEGPGEGLDLLDALDNSEKQDESDQVTGEEDSVRSAGAQAGPRDQNEPRGSGSGTVAGVVASFGVAIIGAITGYFAYLKKKLCFKPQGRDPEKAKEENGAQNDPQVLSNLLNSP